jgi:recombination protein RecA
MTTDQKTVSDLFIAFNKKAKSEICTSGSTIHNCTRIPFSSPRANYVLYGGIPRGRIIEFAGDEGSGKTTTALDVVKNAQTLFRDEWESEIYDLSSREKLSKEQSSHLQMLRERGPLKVLWIDCETTYDDEWAGIIGVDSDNMLFITPEDQYAEEIFEMTLQLIETGEIGLVVNDSLGHMVSQQEMEKSIEDAVYGGIAKALTKFSKKLANICKKTNCAYIGINQVRDNLNAGYGGPTVTTPGGKCWRHECSVRLMFRKGTMFDEEFKDVKMSCENPYGHNVTFKRLKSKISKNNRTNGFYTLTYTEGIEPLVDLISLAIDLDIIHKSGAWFKFVDRHIDSETGEIVESFLQREDEDGEVDDIKVQGQASLIPFLKDESNSYILEMITSAVDKIIYAK